MIAALQSDDNDKRQKWKKDIKNDKCFKRIEKEIIKRNSWHRKIGLFVTLYYGTDLLEWLEWLGNCFQLEKVWQDNLKFTAAGAQYNFPREQDLDFCTVLIPCSLLRANTSWTKYFSKYIFFKSSFEVWLDIQWLAHPWESGEKSLSECKKLTTLPNFVIPSQSSAFYPNWTVGNLSRVISPSLFRGGD